MSRRLASILVGTLGGAAMGLAAVFFSPVSRQGLIAPEVQVLSVIGLTLLGAWFGRMYDDAR